MDRKQFLAALEEALMLDQGTLAPTAVLDELAFDSMAILEFQALVDENYGIQVEPDSITSCKTVDDLWTLIQKGVAG
jgi:acyl carrier protein